MEFVNVSVPWIPERKAMIPAVVEKQLRTEQVRTHFKIVTVEIHCTLAPRKGVARH